MITELYNTFDGKEFKDLVQKKLPALFQLAEKEMNKGGHTGMEVGTVREQILIALLIHWFGPQAVDSTAAITEAEVDVRLKGKPISIKTYSNKYLVGFKLSWAVDKKKATDFKQQFKPSCDILLARVNWGGKGELYYIPFEAQTAVLQEMGRDEYFKLPKEGTNPRGTEITTAAIRKIAAQPAVKVIDIMWDTSEIEHDPYKRWVDYWKET